ncbi:interleukin-32 isoform X2 [Suricata suricatta]|nr:interleukin-32 isoform X2 [Suricata suricatta]
MRHEMCRMVHNYCDNLQQLQGAQERRLARQEMENGFNEVMLQTVGGHLQDNDQESSPLLPELRQELRYRFWRPSVPDPEEEDDPGVQDTQEAFWDRGLRWFRRLLRRLQQTWQEALAWLKRKVAAGWQAVCPAVQAVCHAVEAVCSAVEAVCSALAHICASVAQVFRSCTQA